METACLYKRSIIKQEIMKVNVKDTEASNIKLNDIINIWKIQIKERAKPTLKEIWKK